MFVAWRILVVGFLMSVVWLGGLPGLLCWLGVGVVACTIDRSADRVDSSLVRCPWCWGVRWSCGRFENGVGSEPEAVAASCHGDLGYGGSVKIVEADFSFVVHAAVVAEFVNFLCVFHVSIG